MASTEEKFEALVKSMLRAPLTDKDQAALAELRKIHGVSDEQEEDETSQPRKTAE